MLSTMITADNPLALYYFYDRVILFYERELKPYPVGLRITNPEIELFLKANSIYPEVVNGEDKIEEPEAISTSDGSFIICRKTNRYSILVSIYEHLRNSFAHGRYSFHEIHNEEYIRLTDISRNGKKTMVAQMPVSVLVGLMETLQRIVNIIKK